jgi:uncharacterized membrane protein YfcA
VPGSDLVVATEVVLLAMGAWLALRAGAITDAPREVGHETLRIAMIATLVGIASGLLANGGGFLFAPLFVVVLGRPLKQAFGTSAALAAVLAVPATVVHAALGHVDWAVTLAFAVAAVPLAGVGARVAMRARSQPLQRAYGVSLAAFSLVLLAFAL